MGQRTCGRACGTVIRVAAARAKKAALPPPPIVLRTCATCGDMFKGAGKYCKHHRGYQSRQGPRNRACATCGAMFEYEQKAGSPQKRCPSCAVKVKADASADNKRRRRARKKINGTIETVRALTVFERDGWRCGICHRTVRKDLKPPHPRAPQLDHIVPLALGGEHTYANTQCSHAECNWTKGARHAGQELLFG